MQEADNIFFSSDQHFGHEKSVQRPPSKAWGTNTRHQFKSVEDMDNGMIDAWNLVVPEDADVFVLGDYAYNGTGPGYKFWALDKVEAVNQQLNGRKHLIVGNHDLPYIERYWADEYKECGFTTVQDSASLELDSITFDLCHFPRWKGPEQKPAHYPEPLTDWKSANWLLHGHTHNQIQMDIPGKMIHVGVDAWSYRPVAASTIVRMALAAEELMDMHGAGRSAPNTYNA